jgi:hypothetical protein
MDSRADTAHPDAAGNARREKKDQRVAEDEHGTEQEQRPHPQEQQLEGELADDCAKVVRPERRRGDESCNRSGNEQPDRVVVALRIPRLAVPDEPGRQDPDGGGGRCSDQDGGPRAQRLDVERGSDRRCTAPSLSVQ